jgi:aldehyde dehydrogenase (NAD+)
VVVAADADLDVAARRILWIKLMNSGQLCIAPDYVLADRTIIGELIDRLTATIETFTAGKPHSGLPIVNETHFRRLVGYLSATQGTIVSGGHCCNASRTIAPTVVVHPAPDEPLMQQEIFGPILPVVAYDSLDEAVSFIAARPKPLAAYVFTRDAVICERLVADIPAGGVVVNHVAMHCLVPQLPFGGVGASGTGAYHGRWGFERLSHRKAVLRTTAWPDPRLIYPPYRPRNVAMMRRLS